MYQSDTRGQKCDPNDDSSTESEPSSHAPTDSGVGAAMAAAAARAGLHDDETPCCPHCGSARYRANSQSHVGRDAAGAYRCKGCNRPFETLDSRERTDCGGGRSGLAGQLADPGVTEVADLDGGGA